MATHDVTHDATSGIITCRIFGSLSDSDAAVLANELQKAIVAARTRSPVVRLLFDNREGTAISPSALEALTEPLWPSFEPDDRTAILVSSSHLKAQARKEARDTDALFISESAALTWLNAWE